MARKKRKPSWRPRLKHLLIALVLLLVLAPITYAALHYANGGTTQQLRDQLAAHAEGARNYLSDTWQRTQQAAKPQPVSVPVAPAPVAQQPSTSPSPAPPPAPAPIRTAPDPAPVSTATAAAPIEVFFAPTTTLVPAGIDDRLLQFLGEARQSIDCAFYDFQFEAAADVLIARHQAGVRVRIVSDSHYEDREALKKCQAAGIPVLLDKRRAFMHHKFAVVDGQAVWSGSTNITENCLYRNNNNAVLVRARPLAVNFTTEFEEMFVDKRFGGRSKANTPYPVLEVGDTRVACYFSPDDGAAKAILTELSATQRSIDVMAFSFTSEPIAEAMVTRMGAGVPVRVLVERRSSGGEHPRDDYLREHGAQVFYDTNANTMHHKVMILDKNRVITGSYNFSKNAEEDNDENLLIFYSAAIAQAFQQEFNALIVP